MTAIVNNFNGAINKKILDDINRFRITIDNLTQMSVNSL